MTGRISSKRLTLLLPAFFIVGTNFILNTNYGTYEPSYEKGNFERPVTAQSQPFFEADEETNDKSESGYGLFMADLPKKLKRACIVSLAARGEQLFHLAGQIQYSTASRAPPVL